MNQEKFAKNDLLFPAGFLWGTASSAHQIEGQNIKNDWWAWEKKGKAPASGKAADHYHRFEEDFDLVKSLGANAHRLSIEWSRIEPKEGYWDWQEVNHYKDVLRALDDRNLKVMVTLHHFTNPLWFTKNGGWQQNEAPKIFNRYVRFLAKELGDKVDFWITINEPMIYAMQAYAKGIFPPGKKSTMAFWKVINNLTRAHKLAYQSLHQQLDGNGKIKVGVAKNAAWFSSYPKKTSLNQIIISQISNFWNHWFYKKTKNCHDFIGINFYFHFRIKFSPFGYQLIDPAKIGRQVSLCDWEIDPEAFYKIITQFSKYHLPIYITENGIATDDENQRKKYLLDHVKKLQQAIGEGTNIGGYFYWTLLDCFEWERGFRPRFGLFKVNFENQQRSITPAGKTFAQIAKYNKLIK